MGHTRRTIDRRRRVFYTSQQAENAPPTAASRREVERLREARKPSEAYGARVQRRIRGRWFSLVPVKQRTAILVSVLILGGSLLLCLAHYLSVSWPVIAGNEAVARPLRLDRADSFGAWASAMLLAGSAGVTLLIYQLRRYRIDDYRGQYRIWRLVLIVTLLASINSLTSTLDWGGALIDLALGKRVALSGSGWLRLLATIGGAILSLRLIAEVRFSRWSLGMMIVSWGLLAIPAAVHWNLLDVDSLATWTLVTSAPLLSSATVFLALGLYLRMLYREVRKVEDSVSLSERFQRMRQQMFEKDPEPAVRQTDRDAQPDSTDAEPSRRQRTAARPVAAVAKTNSRPAARTAARPAKRQRDPDIAAHEEEQESSPKKKSGSLWSRMRGPGKPAAQTDDDDANVDSSPTDRAHEGDGDPSDPDTATTKKRWWNRKRQAADEINDDETNERADDQSDPASDAAGEEEDAARIKRRWLGLRRGKTPQDADEKADDGGQPAPKKKRGGFSLRLRPQPNANTPAPDDDRDEPVGGDDEPENKKKRGIGSWLKRRSPDADEPGDDQSEADQEANRPVAQPRQAQNRRNDADHDGGDQGEDYIDENDIDWASLSKAERRRLRKQLKRQGRAA